MSTRLITPYSQHPVLEKPGLKHLKDGAKWCREIVSKATWESRVLPDLVVVGVQRSGTTAMTDALYRQPYVERSRRGKGTHFFSYNYYRNWEWFQGQFPRHTWADRVQERTGRAMFVMDACPYYMFHPFAIERMGETLPEVKVLVALRDPVRRAESHYHHSVAHGHEDMPFAEALELEDERVAGEVEKMAADVSYWSHSHEHHSYVAKGFYAEQLERVFKYYDADQVKIVQAEAFFKQPDAVLSDLTDWLGLPRVSFDETDGSSGGSKLNGHKYEKMGEATRAKLAEIYREPNEKLYDLIGERYDWIS